MTASGALAFDGRGWPWEWPLRWTGFLDPTLFTIVTKTLTRHPRPGNLRWSHPWSVVRSVGSLGIVNAIGLTNKGIDWWLKEVAPQLNPAYKIIVSIEADDENETLEMIDLLKGQNILGIELNLSCPNSSTKDNHTTEKIISLCQKAAQHSSFPLIAKLSVTHDYVTVAKQLANNSRIEALSINSVPWKVFFHEWPSPLAQYGGGGLSGKLVQPFTWKMVEDISKNSKIPVIGPSVWNYEDIHKVTNHGAKAVSFGSVFVKYPWRPTLFVNRWTRESFKNRL